MARTDAGAQLTDRHRQAQAAVSAAALRDFLRLWPLWQIEDQARQQREDRSFAAMVAATIILIRAYHQASASLAAAYFTSFRSVEDVAGFAAPRVADPIDAERITSSLYVTGRVMTQKALQAGQPPQKARETAFVRTSGAVTRHVLQGGRDTVVLSTGEDPKAQKWARVTRGTPCAFCAAIASRGAVFLGHDTAEFQAHDHCVPGWTIVDGPSVEVGYRRWYEGELVVICLAGGDELTITPNHPVLTERGWVEAGLLRETDYVARRFGADLASLHVPHENDVPAAIEDVWGAPGMDRLRSVPVAAEDFHGDGVGSKGNVDVVAPHRLLSRVLDATAGQVAAERVGARAGGAAVANALAAERDLALMLLRVRHAASCGMCGGGLGRSLLGGHGGEMDMHRALDAATVNAAFIQPAGDHVARYAVPVGEGLFGSARSVSLENASGHRHTARTSALAGGTRFDTASTEGEPDLLRAQSDLGRGLLERLAGGVQLRSVVDLRRIRAWSGNVYNLQTAEGWYGANGVIVSNCNCTAEPHYEGSALPPDSQRWRDLYNKAQREARANDDLERGTSNDALNAFRRSLAAH